MKSFFWLKWGYPWAAYYCQIALSKYGMTYWKDSLCEYNLLADNYLPKGQTAYIFKGQSDEAAMNCRQLHVVPQGPLA